MRHLFPALFASVSGARVPWGRTLAAALALLPAFSLQAQAEGAPTLSQALTASKPIADFRLRSEHVDQQGIDDSADALTLRGRLGFESGAFQNTRLLAEAELLWPLRSDYNSTTNGHAEYPIVNDPESYEVNRLQLTNTSLPDTTVTIGRQRVLLDDERFISRVGWRQNEQTFDAARVVNKSISNVTLDATYLNQVNRVLGRESSLGRYHGPTYLANAAWHTPVGDLVGFGYWLNFDEAPRDSSRTLGMRFAGDRTFRAVKFAYLASYAEQKQSANNPLDFDNAFYVAELIGTMNGVSLGAGFEVLEGDGTKGFSTPLATIHKFVGTADKFLTTPPNGLARRYATLNAIRKHVGPLDEAGLRLAYHDFKSSRLGLHYGHEVDAQVHGKWQRYIGIVKYARYNAAAFATDTTKFWLQLEYIL